uniref:IQ motif containing with AAA domain 1 n=1 Tax=Sinocyclocheilus grahami TaxID=75366 RepID=A0A672RUE8_SINGR
LSQRAGALNSSYGQMWNAAQGALEDLLEDEYPTMQLRPQKDCLQVFQTLATFYLRYLKIFRALEEVYDRIVHPQKRRVVHQVLEGVMGRLVELKNEMVELEYSEFHYFDDILQDFKMTPEDLEVPIPRYFVREKMRALKAREKMLAHILAKGGRQECKIVSVPVQSMSVERALWLLQVSERARQGRLRARFMKTIRQEEQRRLQGNSTMLDPNQAATCIQKVWRGHRDRRRVNKECLEEMIFLGLQTTPSPAQLHAQQVESRRHCVQEEHEAEYQKALVSIKESVRSVDGPDVKESLHKQIRQWFIELNVLKVAAEFAAKEEEREKKKKLKREKDKKANDRKKKKGKMKGKKGKGDTEVGPFFLKYLYLQN